MKNVGHYKSREEVKMWLPLTWLTITLVTDKLVNEWHQMSGDGKAKGNLEFVIYTFL